MITKILKKQLYYLVLPEIIRNKFLCSVRNGSQSPDRWDTLIPLDVGTSLTVQTVAESNNIKNGGLEDYNNISDGIFPQCTTPSKKISLG